MLRVFLVIDDYNELMHLQTLLKKIGFDVEGLTNQKKYQDVSLGFNPQILVTTSHGKKVDGVLLARNINKRRGMPKILAVKTDEKYSATDFEDAGVDLVIDSPISPSKLLIALANLGGVDEAVLIDKYNKMKTRGEVGPDPGHHGHYDENGQAIEDVHKTRSAIEQIVQKPASSSASGGGTGSSGANFSIKSEESAELAALGGNLLKPDPARNERFDKWKKKLGPIPNKNFDREKIRSFNKKLRMQPSQEDAAEVEEGRKQFVKALFKPK